MDLGIDSIGWYVVVFLKRYDDLSYLSEDIILAGGRIFESSIGVVERNEFKIIEKQS